MDAEIVVIAMRGGWLTLCFMMLLSRVLFQVAGPVRMRRFLDQWARSRVKRVWGALSLAYAALLMAGAVASVGGLTVLDLVLLGALVVVLVADGLVNAMPAGFTTFKDSVQQRWVRRNRNTEQTGDRDLFSIGNLVLALLAGGTATLVALYRPLEPELLWVALALTALLTPALLTGALLDRPSETGADLP